MNKKKTYESYDDKKQRIIEKSKRLRVEKTEYLKKLTIEYFYNFVKNEEVARALEDKRGDKEFIKALYENLESLIKVKRGESVENGTEKGV
ncbi:MAG: hypothetical protein ACRC4Z_03100 [Fusobacteriaceae bacterium]